MRTSPTTRCAPSPTRRARRATRSAPPRSASGSLGASTRGSASPTEPDGLLAVHEQIHQCRFGARSAGSIWIVKAATATTTQPDASGSLATGAARPPLPDCATLLDALNVAQRRLDALELALESL